MVVVVEFKGNFRCDGFWSFQFVQYAFQRQLTEDGEVCSFLRKEGQKGVTDYFSDSSHIFEHVVYVLLHQLICLLGHVKTGS